MKKSENEKTVTGKLVTGELVTGTITNHQVIARNEATSITNRVIKQYLKYKAFFRD